MLPFPFSLGWGRRMPCTASSSPGSFQAKVSASVRTAGRRLMGNRYSFPKLDSAVPRCTQRIGSGPLHLLKSAHTQVFQNPYIGKVHPSSMWLCIWDTAFLMSVWLQTWNSCLWGREDCIYLKQFVY